MHSLSIIPQRQRMDCGIAALAMLCGLPYEDVYVAACHVDKKGARRGLNLKQLQAIAERCGFRLERRHKYDLDEDGGILHVARTDKWYGHYVVLFKGVLVDPDGGRVCDPADYLILPIQARTLLVRADS